MLEDAKPESIGDAADLALPPEMPILIDSHALKDILGPPLYELEVMSLILCLHWCLLYVGQVELGFLRLSSVLNGNFPCAVLYLGA